MPGIRDAARGHRGDSLGTAELCGVALSDGHVPNIRASDGHEGFYAAIIPFPNAGVPFFWAVHTFWRPKETKCRKIKLPL